MDADSTAPGDQGFTFIGEGILSGATGELGYQVILGTVFLFGDTNGDSAPARPPTGIARGELRRRTVARKAWAECMHRAAPPKLPGRNGSATTKNPL